jgi:hypothetical protein
MGARRLRLRRPSSERLTSAAAQEDLVKSPASCPKPVLSATALPPSPLYRENASTTRVHNQRRTTTGVTAFCDRHGHGTPARLRPRLRHRPATTSPGRCPRARGCYRVYRDHRRARTHRPTSSTSSTSSDRRISALVERLRRLERCPLVPRSQPPDDPDRLLDALIDLVGQPPGDRPERHRPKGVARDETRGVLAPP